MATVEFERVKDLFDLNEVVFSVMGVWPLKATYVKFTIWIIYLVIHMSAQFVNLYSVFGDLELVTLNLSESTWNIMVILKLLVMRFSGTLAKLTKTVIDGIDARHFETQAERDIYLYYNQLAKSFFKLWLAVVTSAALVYHVKTMDFPYFTGRENRSMHFVLPYRTNYFFEVNDSLTYWLVWAYQGPVICINISQAATIGYLFTLILHICGKMSVLAYRIKNVNLELLDERDSSAPIFRDIVQRHQHILRLVHDINAVFGLLLMEELLIFTLLIGLSCYSVLVYVDFEHTAVFLAFFLYCLTLLSLMYGYCVSGEYLIVESANLYAAYYQCEWYNMSNSFKKQLLLCMIGAHKPITLTAGGFYTFSLVSFTRVLKTAAGYISMLRAMT